MHKNLEPVSIGDDIDDEVLEIEAKLANTNVRQINAYGPQESSNEDVKNQFFGKLDEVIKRAKLSGSLICLVLNANIKLGPDIYLGNRRG